MRDIVMLELANLSKHYLKLVEETPLLNMDSHEVIQIGSDDFKKTFAKYDKTSIDERWTMLSAEMYDVKFIAMEFEPTKEENDVKRI